MKARPEDFYQQAPPDRGASSFVYPPSAANLRFFAAALKAGCVVAMPTETVYGLAALASCHSACEAVFRIKGRPLLDPLILHFHDLNCIHAFADTPAALDALAGHFWPGPLTVILRKKPAVSDLISAGRPTVAVRIPAHPVAQALIAACGGPLAAPSANPFGYISPVSARHVTDCFGPKVPFVVDGGSCSVGVESTILDLSAGQPFTILRPGGISPAQLSAVLGYAPAIINTRIAATAATAAKAPGTFAKHYSPATRLHLFAQGDLPAPSQGLARIFIARPVTVHPGDYWFSETGEPQQVAHSLYALLRQLDSLHFAAIACELPAAQGLLCAVADRLQRAAST